MSETSELIEKIKSHEWTERELNEIVDFCTLSIAYKHHELRFR